MGDLVEADLRPVLDKRLARGRHQPLSIPKHIFARCPHESHLPTKW
jgi:hypothetical protein